MNAFIIDAKRSPIGRAHPTKGIFRDIRADELLAQLFKDFAERMDPNWLEDIFIGCVGQHLEQGKNIARLTSLLAGYPQTVPATTTNRLCASSLQALNEAAMTLHCGQADFVMAGGVEHMQHVPMGAALDYHQGLLKQYEFPFNNMGLTAEKVASTYNIDRLAQDNFALRSHQKACEAQDKGYFKNEILPIKLPGEEIVDKDQGPRATSSLESLGKLKTVFKKEGTVTAGNCSPLSDGASLILVGSEKACQKHDLTKRAKIVDTTVIGLDPCMMGMGPVGAIKKLLARQKLTIGDIDCFELNEAFASQAIACNQELKIPEEKVNLNGGAIALGHPLGCTGTRLVTTLLHNLERTQSTTGIASMCIGHGQGMAMLIERV